MDFTDPIKINDSINKLKNILKFKLVFLTKSENLSYFFKNHNPLTNLFCKNSNTLALFELQPLIFKNKKVKKLFLKKSITLFKASKSIRVEKKIKFFIFFNKFLINFIEFFLKSKIIFNLKKGSNKLILNQISSRKFYIKYFKRNLKITKQILGILYYSLILKDSFIFVNFFKKILEKLNVKSHKKVFLGLKKLLKDVFKPLFSFFGVNGIFFNVKGKIGVSGSAKKRRYYFYYSKHSITNRTIKVDIKYTPVWTFTGSLGFTFLIFY